MQARLRREGRVDLDETVIDRTSRLVEPHLDHAEPAVDGVEQGAVPSLALREHALRGPEAGDVELAREEVPEGPVRVEDRADVELVAEGRAVAMVVQDLHDDVARAAMASRTLATSAGSVPAP